ncbi:glucose-6-phosphate isomerase [Brevibacillus parabrevis]|jgi:glucose-6-phosphate isomerase|uniref:Glucose-6-phosphate isomerase n=1 Tax=Brevibacillus parabrevis TaxID=54914 RepID=A0A4Y3PC47_BREPA|nr:MULTISPECIES: glucose-6-phosphate isomerase [Brevibacillus]KZE46264.1 glucose-6-phosphate isomerase [Brevibacillus parabrevis]MBU8715089.1 glucose-6-phosphate isomerase [Brevibacillus parabrevis]MDH6352413.1 glucose-6-phosphate isomerase [Brevibacillus sp. 1238]MED2255147.1 glucose-6-phosphate isomerase [Brevibacillus parabrevis]RNB93013.1 glucose-6-phosphate isomerase [Brevibacillus parabrevis]
MNQAIRFDYSNARGFVRQHEWEQLAPAIGQAHEMLHKRTGPGRDYLGWVDWPNKYDRVEYERIRQAAARIQADSDVLLVIGIGGSYLGAKAVLDVLGHSFYNLLPKSKRRSPEIYFVGNNISPVYISHLMDVLEGKDVSINVISKSGTTTEPAIAFRLLRNWLENKYGREQAKKRIYITTDKARGALKKLAEDEGYESFVIPDDIGGRFSVLTAVGLLPIAVSGADMDALMKGAQDASERYMVMDLAENPCYQYAAIRNALYRKGKTVELLVSYEPQFRFFAEWWKQLFGESEGKDGKGIFPAAAEFSTDLHSLGQYIQDGMRHLFETVVTVNKPAIDVTVEEDPLDVDGLNFLSGKRMGFVNKKAFEGTVLAHVDGGVPNLLVEMPEATAYHLGALIYFFEKACGISGYLLGVNPFDQPGVEAYKANMFALLGKPGFEQQKAELEARLRDNKTYLTVEETAAYLELPETFILEKIHQGKIRALHDGYEYVINKEQFNHHMEEMRKLREFEEAARHETVPESYDVKDED